jgi:signal recognition particle receptor subunit alpha
MLEELLIFTRGGLILWALSGGAAVKASPVDALIRSCLLEDRSGDGTGAFEDGKRALKWSFHNGLGLVFVAVYRRVLRLLYVDDLLAAVRAEFARIYHPKRTNYDGFSDVFRQLHLEAQARAEEMNKSKQAPVKSRPPPPPSASRNVSPNVARDSGGNAGERRQDGSNGDSGKDENSGAEPEPKDGGAFNLSMIQNLFIRKNYTDKKNKPVIRQKNHGKKPSDNHKKLDFSDLAERGKATDHVAVNQGQSKVDMDEQVGDGPKAKGWFSSVFQSIAAGNTVIGKSDLQPALKALKDKLMTKNVAEEIAEKLCESVAASLEGKKLGSFTSISSTVQAAMEEALLRILTPSRSIDILRDVHTAKEGERPYVIVFVGVNGVGKSTNLAKVAYWLLQHDLSVTLAACDTFRSGAVEQLRTHARRLQVPIFEKGYERDPAVVAKQAIQEATRTKSDVVLVDTAGRMQDNEPLMRALSKLINLNKPDLVLFVGEALVGNDAVDQLTQFNQKLADLSPVPASRLIDGILLSKFDTVDDKVGAALSMVYVSGAPVMFVGCGQSYTDLKKLNVKSIVNTLLK